MTIGTIGLSLYSLWNWSPVFTAAECWIR